ncbi:ABC transporter ATP-binding protein/permease [Gordonia sp. ABSL11-1]|uniref:ABC transporter ATP-binding protein/permease n=1 Tax=Gordonia sp. ABSL11-1 TaxID=3053924 RepID=UPI002573E1AC|nr:ABC transporter ATP-binding protein/permease [Gordonia sp. ABSL11-1]MDL9944490.1 ABC transporter ATP-binding protein/permease [Gordonia sp. ABSL11-1]
MEYSIDWSTEIWTSLRWIVIASAISLAGLLLVGFVIARFTRWGQQFWRVNGDFFAGPSTRVVAWGYILALLIFCIFGVRMSILFSYWGNDLFTSLQNVGSGLNGQGPQAQQLIDAGKAGFWHSMWVFAAIAAVHVVRTLVELYIGAAFEIRWRQWLTSHATADWMRGRAFYRNRFVDLGDDSNDSGIQPGIDNPDQRIEADITNVAQSSRLLLFSSGGSSTNGVIPALVTIVSFTQILWNLSGPMTLWGVEIPRMMVWLVFMYVLIATVIAFWIGHPLIRLNFWRERLTANFRYALVRVRDGAENVAFYRGERVEHDSLMGRFAAVIANYWQIIYRNLKFVGWNFSITQLSVVFPYLVQAPRFFEGRISLGDVTQTSDAFGNVHDALSFFRNSYDDFADLRASIIRLDGLEDADKKSRTLPAIATADRDRAVRLTDVDIATPSGDELIRDLTLSLDPGDALVVKGRSGSGKTTLLRGLAGLWPFVDGEFTRPAGDRTLFLSQIPYIPLGDLRTAVAYPALPDDVGDDAIRAALEQVFLPHLTGRLADEEDWSKVLSPGEQQRVAFARILLTRPEVVFMDEATSAVDEGLEYSLYTLIRTELPDTILVSVSHRSTTDQHHTEVLELTGGGAWELRPVAS